MKRGIPILAIGLAMLAGPLHALSGDEQLRAQVAHELPRYVTGVDVDDLSGAQLAFLYSIIQSKWSEGRKRSHIRSTLGDGYSLRGLLFDKN